MGILRDRELALADEVLAKKRVYLDTKYWIYCRDALTGSDAKPAKREVLEILRRRASDGDLICPLDEVILSEIFNHGDRERRTAMALVLEELSRGVCLKPFFTKLEAELSHFLTGALAPSMPLIPLERLVWTRVAFAFGAFAATNPRFTEAENVLINEAFDDHLWSMTTPAVFEYWNKSNQLVESIRWDHSTLASRLNVENAAHANEASSWTEVYETEVRGTIDALREQIWEVYLGIQYRLPEVVPAPPIDVSNEHYGTLASALAAAFLRGKLWRRLPTIHIHATLHARVRWDKQRRLKANDFGDFRHASAALAHCQLFLTESSLAASLASGTPSLASQFKAVVVADLDEAVAALEAL